MSSSRRRRFNVPQRHSLKSIMEYPVLGHYDPTVEATDHGSGEEEQELLCKYHASFPSLSPRWISGKNKRKSTISVAPRVFLSHARRPPFFTGSDRGEPSEFLCLTLCFTRPRRFLASHLFFYLPRRSSAFECGRAMCQLASAVSLTRTNSTRTTKDRSLFCQDTAITKNP